MIIFIRVFAVVKTHEKSEKRSVSFPSDLLARAEARAAGVYGGTLSRYIQDLLKRDLGETDQPISPLPAVAGCEVAPDVVAQLGRAMLDWEDRQRLLRLLETLDQPLLLLRWLQGLAKGPIPKVVPSDKDYNHGAVKPEEYRDPQEN